MVQGLSFSQALLTVLALFGLGFFGNCQKLDRLGVVRHKFSFFSGNAPHLLIIKRCYEQYRYCQLAYNSANDTETCLTHPHMEINCSYHGELVVGHAPESKHFFALYCLEEIVFKDVISNEIRSSPGVLVTVDKAHSQRPETAVTATL